MIPSPQEIADAQTDAGGWHRDQLAEWGVPWPPPKGWRKRLEDRYHVALRRLVGEIKQHRRTTLDRLEKLGPHARMGKQDKQLYRALEEVEQCK